MGKENDLITAVKEGNCQYVRKLLQRYRKSSKKSTSKKSTINLADVEGFTALHHAALLGDVEIVMAIIEMEGDPNSRDKKGMTPLHMAAWAGKDAAVKCLVENRALPNLPSLNGETPLHLAAQHGYAGCAKVLLAAHADGTFRSSNFATPLDLACQYGHTAVVKQLLQNEAVTFAITSPTSDARHPPPLHLSAKSGHDDIVHLLLQAGADVNESRVDGTALHLASLYGKKNVVKLLLAAGGEVAQRNKDGLIPLDLVNQFTASRAGLEIKQLLREAAGERVVYAKAVSDYKNQYDLTCLNFKAGDNIAVLEQNEDGRWKGYLVNSENDKPGYFPAMAVKLATPASSVKTSQSVNSMASGTSSVDSGSRGNQTPERSNEPASLAPVPVGLVPIGNFEVMTLAQGEHEFNSPPKQTAAGSLPPRMSSFKNKQKYNQQKTPTSPIRSPRLTNRAANNFPPPPPQRSVSDESALQHTPFMCSGSHTLKRQPIKEPEAEQSGDYRKRAASAGAAQNEFTKSLKQAIGDRHDVEKQQPIKTNNYAEIEINQPTSPAVPTKENTGYTTVYFTDQTDGRSCSFNNNDDLNALHEELVNRKNRQNSVNTNSNNSVTHGNHFVSNSDNSVSHGNKLPLTPTQTEAMKPLFVKTTSHESTTQDMEDTRQLYEDMGITNTRGKQNEDQIVVNNNRAPPTAGYEDMTGEFIPKEEAPQLPLKLQQPQSASSEMLPPSLPLKRCSTAPQKPSSPVAQYKSSFKQTRDMTIYENHDPSHLGILRTSSLGSGVSPTRSPHSPNAFPQFLSSPASPSDGRRSPLDQRSSRTDQEVLDWLNELKLTCYYDSLKSHGFDMDSIRAITPEDLNFLEISKTGHRKKLLSEIAKLPDSDRLPTNKPHDVGAWLGQLNLRQYEPNFVEGGFDDMEFIKDLDKSDLDMIDIKKRGHQKKLLLAVRQLNDLELTDILDQAVLESPLKRAPSFNRTGSASQSSESQFSFPPAFKSEDMAATTAVYPREDLPPPSGEEQKHPPPSPRRVPPVAAKPNGNAGGKVPIPVPSPKPKLNGNVSGGKPLVAPMPKPKPKPAIKPLPNGQTSLGNPGKVSRQPPTGEVQGSQEEVVASSRSRDFFKQQEKKALVDDSPTNSLERHSSTTSSTPSDSSRKSSLSSDQITPPSTVKRSPGKPLVPPPSLKPKPINTVPEQVVKPPAPVPVKKAPPPAPPRRGDSIKDTAPSPPPLQDKPRKPATPSKSPRPTSSDDICFSPPMPNFTPPPPVPGGKPRGSPTSGGKPSGSPTVIDFPPPPPIELIDNEPEDIMLPQPKQWEITANDQKAIDDGFGETDDMLSDIMADLEDFSSQLDKMF